MLFVLRWAISAPWGSSFYFSPMYHELILLQASDACHFFTSGQAKIQQCLLREGHDLITEALNLLNNVYGAMHPDISSCLRLLARINYILGDYPEVQLSYHNIQNLNFLLLPVLHSKVVNRVILSRICQSICALVATCFVGKSVLNRARLVNSCGMGKFL